MGQFSGIFLNFIFQYNFGDSWDIHGMRPVILGSPTITVGIMKYHSHGQRRVIYQMFGQFLWHLWKGTGDYWYYHGM
jgi:hypothetical protein